MAQITCRYHPNAHLIEDHRAGDMICSACGIVVGDRIVDVTQEWRCFDDSTGDPSRVGASENPLLNSDLTTMIGATNPNNLDEQGNPRYRNRSSLSAENRQLVEAFRLIDDFGERGFLDRCIRERAKEIFKEVHDKDKERQSKIPRVAAALHIACREEHCGRSYKEIGTITGVSTKKLTKAITAIEKIRGKRLEAVCSRSWLESFIPRNCFALNLDEVAQVAEHIAIKSIEQSICLGRSYTSVAAAAIYLAAMALDIKKPIKDICEKTGCADGTLKQVCKLMQNADISKLLPPNFKPAISIEELNRV